jgi:hypothetical protein
MSEGPAPPRRIRLCADDYGLSCAVNRGIRELIDLGRLNATSVMMVASAIDRAEVKALADAARENRDCAIGVHVTLTAPFRPLTLHFRPLDADAFPGLPALLARAVPRLLDREILRGEIAAQIDAFMAAFGRPPDFVDGHQHVHLFPRIRDAFADAVKERAPAAFVRQCGRAQAARGPRDAKALLLDHLSRGFRRAASARGLAMNTGFAGVYDFSRKRDLAALVGGFLDALPDGGLMMCHPGFVDDELIAHDPVTDQREREFRFLAGDDFPKLLAERNMTLSWRTA